MAGPAAFDRLSALAARIVDAGHAKVTLFTDQDTVVGGFGLPPGVIGGPALLTGALSAIVVRQRAPSASPTRETEERIADLPAVTSGQVRSYLGSPLVAASGHVVGALAVYDPEPRNWTDDETELLLQLAASVVAELELSAARSAVGTSVTRLNVALEASSIGTWERDLRTGVIDWDERCAALFGLDRATQFETEDSMESRFVHPDDVGPLHEAMQRAMEEDGQFTAEFRALTVDGAVRWMVAAAGWSTIPAASPCVLLGTIIDVTETRRQAARRRPSAMERATAIAEVAAELANAARMQDLPEIVQRGAQVLGAQSSALAVFDPDDGPLRLHMTNRLTDEIQVHVDYPVAGLEIELDEGQPTQYAAMHGRRVLLADRDEAVARSGHQGRPGGAQHPRGGRPAAARGGRILGRSSRSGRPSTRSPRRRRVLEALAAQIALSVSRLQADAERASAVAAMGEANQRLKLLAEAGRILSGTLEIDQQVRELAELVVPDLADWCWLVVSDEQGRLHGMASAHRDPSRREEVAAYVPDGRRDDRRGRRSGGHAPGLPMTVTTVDWDRVEQVLRSVGAEALARLGVGSGTVVPLVARGQTPGPSACSAGRTAARSARPRSTPPSRSAWAGWRCTTRGSSASSGRSPTRCSAACSRTRRSRTTRTSSSATYRLLPGPRSAATGTTPSSSPAARRWSRSATSSATTPGPPPRWVRCAVCSAASGTPAVDRLPRC